VTADGAGAERRVWAALPEGTRELLETRLSSSDLSTLWLAVARARAETVKPADLVRRWRRDRFVQPAAIDPRRLAEVDAWLWQLLPGDVVGVELSPVAPLATCSAVAPVSQNRVVPTARLTEVVSDSTNALAVEAAVRRQAQAPGQEVHLAASCRQLRAQTFRAGAAAHFRLFALVSSARDTGSARTEARLLLRHLQHWRTVLEELVPNADATIRVTVLDHASVRDRFTDTVLPALDSPSVVAVVEDAERVRGRGYYSGVSLRITAGPDGDDELGDGGLTTWTSDLMGNAKERCVVSCIATERLVKLLHNTDAPAT
jgi:hypothetical protein